MCGIYDMFLSAGIAPNVKCRRYSTTPENHQQGYIAFGSDGSPLLS